jgi:hypothetical protein
MTGKSDISIVSVKRFATWLLLLGLRRSHSISGEATTINWGRFFHPLILISFLTVGISIPSESSAAKFKCAALFKKNSEIADIVARRILGRFSASGTSFEEVKEAAENGFIAPTGISSDVSFDILYCYVCVAATFEMKKYLEATFSDIRFQTVETVGRIRKSYHRSDVVSEMGMGHVYLTTPDFFGPGRSLYIDPTIRQFFVGLVPAEVLEKIPRIFVGGLAELEALFEIIGDREMVNWYRVNKPSTIKFEDWMKMRL